MMHQRFTLGACSPQIASPPPPPNPPSRTPPPPGKSSPNPPPSSLPNPLPTQWLQRVWRMARCGSASHLFRCPRYTVRSSCSGKRRWWGELHYLLESLSITAHLPQHRDNTNHTPCRSILRWFPFLASSLCYYWAPYVPKPFPAPPFPTRAYPSQPPRVAKAPPGMGHRLPGCLRYHMMRKLSRLILVWTRESVAVCHCITWFHTSLLLTMCHIRGNSHLWDHPSLQQLNNLVPRGNLRYHVMYRVRQLILVWTRKSVAASHCVTGLQTQLILTVCHIRCHSDLCGHYTIGQLGTLVPRRCLGSHMMHGVRQLILVCTSKRVVVSHCLTWFET